MDNLDLKPGDKHYMAYVGPPAQYDFMGATQFRLLCTLGLRASHYLLDFGCGSLRSGRLFLGYLEEARYYGVEPNKWLIEEGIKSHIGEDLIKIKKPCFDYNEDFAVNFDVKFDYIVAQSIFSHTGKDLVQIALANFKGALKDNGMIVVTFVENKEDFKGDGWIYPGITPYRRSTIRKIAKEVGLFAARIPWYHPRQTWYVLAKSKHRLPNCRMSRHLTGAVLFDPEFYVSWNKITKAIEFTRGYMKKRLPPAVTERLKKWFEDSR